MLSSSMGADVYRMSLSMKNGWLDDETGSKFIYTVDAHYEDLDGAKLR